MNPLIVQWTFFALTYFIANNWGKKLDTACWLFITLMLAGWQYLIH